MSRVSRVFLFVIVLIVCNISAFALPDFLETVMKDPMAKPGAFTACGACHINPEGGGDRNPFGTAFQYEYFKVTPMLRAQFPDRFVFPVAKVSDTLVISLSDPENKEIVVEVAGKRTAVNVEKKTVDGAEAKAH